MLSVGSVTGEISQEVEDTFLIFWESVPKFVKNP